MFFTKLTAAAVLAVTAVSAQIATPAALYQCQPIQISWEPTTGPYYLSVIPGNQPSAAPLINFGEVASSPVTWTVNVTAGTSVGYALVDSTGVPKYSEARTVGAGSDSCLSAAGGAASAESSGATAGGVAASASSAASSVAAGASSDASSVAAGASSAASSVRAGATSAASGATGSTRPTGTNTGAAASSTTPANGASKVESAGLMVAALAVVVAAAI